MRLLLTILLTAVTAMSAEITAYCKCQKCCGRWSAGGRTYSGRRPVQGITIAGPRRIPLGSWVQIDGIGTFRVDDRLSRRFDHRWDVYFSRHEDAKRFGLKRRNVKVL